MKRIFKIFQILALLGFIISTSVHITSIFGVILFEGAMLLHIGVFIVFIPAIFVNFKTLQAFNFKHSIFKLNPIAQLKALLRGCPDWMIKFTYALFAYAILNFIYFSVTQNSTGRADMSGVPPEVLRGFSGHWMIFYWAAFAILYSHVHSPGDLVTTCLTCKSPISPVDKFCSNCGKPI